MRNTICLLVVALAWGCGREPSESEVPGPIEPAVCANCNVVLISIDTLRADHLGSYGYSRNTSPRIDEFAGRSVLFENSYSASFLTADSHMSLFTSLPPSVHQVGNASAESINPLSPKIRTLAEELEGAGYDTMAFHGGGNVSGAYGFERGFDEYRPNAAGFETYTGDHLGPVLQWLDGRREQDSPFFLFFHTYRVHDPYLPSPGTRDAFLPAGDRPALAGLPELLEAAGDRGFQGVRDNYWEQFDADDAQDIDLLKALYDAQILEADAFVGELIERVQRDFPHTVVVLTSDHGEEFQEHGRFLHGQLYEELLRVPLVVSAPGFGPGRRISERVASIDVAPTILDLIGVQPPEQFLGRSLLPLVGGGEVASRDVVAERVAPDDGSGTRRHRIALISGTSKLIARPGGQLLYFDLESDPGERNNLAAESRDAEGLRELMAQMRALNAVHEKLKAIYAPQEGGETRTLDAEILKELRGLGYLQ